MPRPGRPLSADFSPAQAQFILKEMIRDGKVTADDLATYRTRLKEEAQHLLDRLRQLGWSDVAAGAAGAVLGAAFVSTAPTIARDVRKAAKKVKKITAEQVANRQLQGRYIATVRRFPKAHRAKFSKVAKQQGREAAIKAMTEELAAGDSQPRRASARGKSRGRK